MSFTSELKTQVLVASARRCCVCKEFKGRNIEVHHITPSADGGEDTFENAIPLCFDCHADAGHYNPRHPRGTKFSPQELREHRDEWYRIVKTGRFASGNTNLTHQYFLCNSFDIVWEILEGNFDNFPVKPVKLVKNEHYRFLAAARSLNPEFSRESDISWKQYESLEDYLSKHPKAVRIEGEWGTTHWEREIEIEELRDGLFHKDFVTNYLIRVGAQAREIAKVAFSEHGCADSYYETILLRGAKTIFATLINSGEKTLNIEAISEHFSNDNSFRELIDRSAPLRNYDLNGIPLAPGECLVIPACTILTPFDDDLSGQQCLKHQVLQNGQSQDTRPTVLAELSRYPTIGPYHNVVNLYGEEPSGQFEERIREVAIPQVLQISRYWECGSCPHLLAYSSDQNEWKYVGELFSETPNIDHSIEIDLTASPFNGIQYVALIEIEKEITHIHRIALDGCPVLLNAVLEPGELIKIDVEGFRRIRIEGWYELFPEVTYKQSTLIKRQKLLHVLRDMNREPNTYEAPVGQEARRPRRGPRGSR